jgi:branched-chain amino acid transport system permease protein
VFAQQILNGIVVGSVYSLFALGFTLVFGVQNILNLAHGALFMVGAFIGLYAVTLTDLPLPVALLAATVGAGCVGVLLDFFAFRPLRKRRAGEFPPIISSIGANLILISIAQQVSDAQVSGFPFGTFPIVIYNFLGLRITLQQIVILGCVSAFSAGLLLLLSHTSFGRQVRAVAVNERVSLLLGVNPSQVYALTFFIAGALAGAAGFIIGIAFNSVYFLMGEPLLLRGFVVVILGGTGSVLGSLVAGFMLGIIQTMSVFYFSSQISDVIIFVLLFLILVFRPTGLFKGLRPDFRVGRN